MTRHSRSRCCSIAALVLLLTGLIAVVDPITEAQANFQPFSPGSPLRTRVTGDAALDPNSAAMVARISRDGAVYANLVEYGIPIYHASADTPRHSVGCTMDWGRCPFDGYQVPIPAGARPSPGSDGAMVVVDASTRQSFEFWQARRASGGWTASWGAVNSLDGSGWGGQSTGSGASRLAGVILVGEIQQSYIPHALAVQTDSACAGEFRPPATRTDGLSSGSDCIPEGARIRLDPDVNLDALGLAPGVRTVAQAMQEFGAFVVDVGGAPLSVSFELDTAGDGSVYRQAGLDGDYDPLAGVPWDRLQVLA